MATSASQKLRIKEGFTLLTVNAPDNFEERIGALPPGVKITSDGENYHQVHWFVKNKAQLDKELTKVLKMVTGDVVCWIYYPKGSSGIQTDLTRDKGWDELLKHDELRWINLVSFDDTWSTFAFRMKTALDRTKEEKPKDRPIFQYVDPKTKTVRLPDDLAAALNKSKKPAEFFNTLSFTNKKEYIEWIVTAKREETRDERLKETIERLAKRWRNPRNI